MLYDQPHERKYSLTDLIAVGLAGGGIIFAVGLFASGRDQDPFYYALIFITMVVVAALAYRDEVRNHQELPQEEDCLADRIAPELPEQIAIRLPPLNNRDAKTPR